MASILSNLFWIIGFFIYKSPKARRLDFEAARDIAIGRASLARGNEAGGSWGQKVHILHVNI